MQESSYSWRYSFTNSTTASRKKTVGGIFLFEVKQKFVSPVNIKLEIKP